MKIETEYMDYLDEWCAWDSDVYDGAPDSPIESRLIGFGKTKCEAIMDLNEQIEEYKNEY